MRIVWSPLASDRVDEIADYIALNSPAAAMAWVERIYVAVGQLGEFPYSGKPGRDVETEDVRELVFESYRVFYEFGECVEVLTVRRGSELIDENELVRD